MSPNEVTLSFDRGTLVIEPAIETSEHVSLDEFVPDKRSGGRLRAPAITYRRALGQLIRAGFDVRDDARGYEELTLRSRRTREPYPHQAEALKAWQTKGRRGLVVLPTGAGKSYVAEMAIADVSRSTLIVAPTIDLMLQWMSLLTAAFGAELVGGLGGGLSDLKPLTATTYDSAYLHIERLGDRYGLIVFDECHHLPGASYAQSALGSIAPYRLGLTATPERDDGGHAQLERLIGPIVYRRRIKELAGRYLATYEVVRVRVELTAEERQRHDEARHTYRSFIAQEGIRMSSPSGWSQFIQISSRSRQGRRAWAAWREQRRIALQSASKLDQLAMILEAHQDAAVIVFTADNDTVYALSRRHLIPALTHQTPGPERRRILEAFNAGRISAVVTSRVLNEGVDMPAASVGVVLSGSGSVREHVQRLGRILRRVDGKEAILYEVITAGTSEEYTSDKRREHGAYRP